MVPARIQNSSIYEHILHEKVCTNEYHFDGYGTSYITDVQIYNKIGVEIVSAKFRSLGTIAYLSEDVYCTVN